MKKILFLATMFLMISIASMKAITINSPSNMSSQYANEFTVSWSGSSNVSVTYKLLMYYPSPGNENETGYGNITGTYTVSGYNTTIPLTSSQWGSAVGRFLKIYISDNSNGTAAATCYVLIKPKVTTVSYTNLTTTSVYINGTASYCTAIYFYRKTGTSSWSSSYYPDISGLAPCTQYEYRVAGTGFPTNYLDEYIYGDTKNFTTLSNTPSTPGTISGSTTVCASGGSQTYSVSSVSGATSYTWTLPSGWSGSSTSTSISATPGSSAQSGYIRVIAKNDCGSSSERTLYITVNTAPSTPSSISGSTTVCAGSGSQTYSISSVSGATSYTWTLPSGWSGSSTSTSISATPGSSAQSGYIRVKANNSCGSSSEQTLSVTVSTPPTATTSISGTTTICSGSSTTLTASGGSTGSGCTYQWYSGGCGSGSVLGTGSSINVSPTTTTTYYVRRVGTSPCSNTTSCASVTVTVNTPPTAPTSISGTNSITNGQNTTLTASGGSTGSGCTYQWGTGTCGSNIISGQTNSSITISPSATTTYWVRRVGTSPCGSTTTSCATQSVTVIIDHTITASAGTGGNISPNGSVIVTNGNSQTFTFTPNNCYEINQVLIDGTANSTAKTNGSYTFSNVTANHTISVSFTQKQYSISASAGSNGSISPSGTATVNCGESKTYTITPNSGYRINQVLVNGSNVGAVSSYIFSNVTANHTISASFNEIPPDYYTINVSASPTAGGSVSGGGTYTSGTSCTVSASANNGYTFTKWTDGNSQVSTNVNYTFTVTTHRTLVANFTANTYTVVYNGNGNTGGSTVSSSHTYGTAKNLTANGFTKTGYTFEGWATSASGSVVYSNNQSVSNLTATNNGTVNLYAKWTPNTYTVVYNGNGNTGGSTTSSNHTYDIAKNLTANGFTRTGYTFEGWATSSSGSVAYSNSQSVSNLTTTNNGTVNLYAKWNTVPPCTIAVIANPSAGGSVSGGGTYTSGNSCTVRASVNDNYIFNNWTKNGSVVSTNANYTFTVSESITLVANFTKKELTVSADNYKFTKNGGTSSSITITSNLSWIISDNASWLTTSKTSGSNVSTFTMTAQANTGASRNAKVTIEGGGITRIINVTQEGISGCSVEPLLKTEWDQSDPYNNLVKFNLGNYPTGCVATAIAQIMKFWEYPTTRTARIDGYNTSSLKFSVLAITGTTTYDWANMKNTTTEYNNNTTAQNAVAKLMYECGVSVKMDYRTGGSGSNIDAAAVALSDNFGYDDRRSIKKRSDYSDNAWNTMLRSELDAGRPIYYRGIDPSQGNAGHAFVCDGYRNCNNENMFHINWGWGSGYNDTWVATSALPLSKYHFNSEQKVIINIKPTDRDNFFPASDEDEGVFAITASESSGGILIPNGTATVYPYTNKIYVFEANEGYEIDQVRIDGVVNATATANGYHTFENVTANHTISVTFKASPTGIEVPQQTQNISVYPNPTKDEIFIKSESPITRLEIYSLTGNLVILETNFNEKISVAVLPQGIYLLRVYTGNEVIVKKIVKE